MDDFNATSTTTNQYDNFICLIKIMLYITLITFSRIICIKMGVLLQTHLIAFIDGLNLNYFFALFTLGFHIHDATDNSNCPSKKRPQTFITVYEACMC